MDQQDFQLNWPQAEIERIAVRVLADYRNALGDHNRRIDRWREYYRRWRTLTDAPAMGEEAASNVPVPYVRWNILTKWAKEMDSLFGDDAEIVAVPVGPSDYKRDAKISKYMTWRVFNSMKLVKPFCEFVNRKLLFGRSVAYSPWVKETFDVDGHDVVDYEGPGFTPLWPGEFIVPAEEVKSLHDFSYVIRSYRTTPDKLLQGEREGRYRGITKNWQELIQLAQLGTRREPEGEEIERAKDEAESILYDRPLSSGESIRVLEWYGRWRPLKSQRKDASEWDFKGREMRQGEFVIRYIKELNLVIGIQDLAQLYPTKKKRRPFVESCMMADGTYWSPGLAELLVDLEDELRTNHNQATESGQLAMQPMFGYRPASGANAETFHVEPGLLIPLDNPQTDIKQIEIHANMDIATWKEQAVLAYGERLTGMSDMALGRQSDRPNAPRTGVQTTALLEEGNVRVSLDIKVLREDMSEVLSHFWDLEYMFAPEEQFFRVTEEDAQGLFEINNGGSMLTIEERDGRYDFRLQFANSVYSREVKKQQALARYQLDLQNPLIVHNPQALWEVTKEAHEALGDPNFEGMVPKPPAPDISINPQEEWVSLLHGEDVHVNPLDNDLVHMTRHMKDAQMGERDGKTDPEALKNLIVHYHDHINQLQQKRIQQAVMEQAVNAMAQIAQGGGAGQPLQVPEGLFGGPQQPTQPPGNPQAGPPQLYSGHPEVMHEQ